MGGWLAKQKKTTFEQKKNATPNSNSNDKKIIDL